MYTESNLTKEQHDIKLRSKILDAVETTILELARLRGAALETKEGFEESLKDEPENSWYKTEIATQSLIVEAVDIVAKHIAKLI